MTREVVDGVEYEDLTPLLKDDDFYCYALVTHKATLGQIIDLLNTFHD